MRINNSFGDVEALVFLRVAGVATPDILIRGFSADLRPA